MCEFSGDKDMWELCRESRRAKSLETFSLCVTDALGCFPRAAPPRLGVSLCVRLILLSFLALAVELQPAQALCQETGNGKEL